MFGLRGVGVGSVGCRPQLRLFVVREIFLNVSEMKKRTDFYIFGFLIESRTKGNKIALMLIFLNYGNVCS